MNKKYELTSESARILGRTIFRIKALRSFGNVVEGEYGGFIENEKNLSQFDNSWVFDDACVFGNARVCGNAIVYNDARIYDNAYVFNNAMVYGNAQIVGNAFVKDNAQVFGNATVSGNARIIGNAKLSGDAKVTGDAVLSADANVFNISHFLVIGPIGSREDYTMFFRTNDLKIGVKCGCFCGDIDAFLKKVSETHGDNQYAKVYRMAAELAKTQIDLTP